MPDAEQQKELAYAVLLLEKQLVSYQKLHEEEMKALWEALAELKARILAMGEERPESGTGTSAVLQERPD